MKNIEKSVIADIVKRHDLSGIFSDESLDRLHEFAVETAMNVDDFEKFIANNSTRTIVLIVENFFDESKKDSKFSFRAFNNVMRIHKYDYFDEESRRLLYRFFFDKDISLARMKDIFNGAKKYAIASSDKYVDFANVKDLITNCNTEEDLRLYAKFNAIDQKLKQYYRETGTQYSKLDDVLKAIWKKARLVSSNTNDTIRKYSDNMIEIMWGLACIYNSLNERIMSKPVVVRKSVDGEIDVRQFLRTIDAIMLTRILECKDATINQIVNTLPKGQKQYELFDDFLYELMDGEDGINSENELFDSDDLVNLITHTPSLVATANRRKLEGARRALNMYIDRVMDMSDKPVLKDFSTKDIFLHAGTILNLKENVIRTNIDLLLGKSMGELSYDITDTNTDSIRAIKKRLLKYIFPNLRIQGMDLNKHMYALKTRNTIMSNLNTNSLYDAAQALVDTLCAGYNVPVNYNDNINTKNNKLKRIGINVDELFTGDNIFDLFPSKFISTRAVKFDSNGNPTGEQKEFIDNIRLLSRLISSDTMQEIIRHNFTFLTNNNETIRKNVVRIFMSAKSQKELLAKFETFINNAIAKKLDSDGNGGPKDLEKRSNKRNKLHKQHITLSGFIFNEAVLKELGLEYDEHIFDTPIDDAKKVENQPVSKKPKTTKNPHNKEIDELLVQLETASDEEDDEYEDDDREQLDEDSVTIETDIAEQMQNSASKVIATVCTIRDVYGLDIDNANIDDLPEGILRDMMVYYSSKNATITWIDTLKAKIYSFKKELKSLKQMCEQDRNIASNAINLKYDLDSAKQSIEEILKQLSFKRSTISDEITESIELLKLMKLDGKNLTLDDTIASFDTVMKELDKQLKIDQDESKQKETNMVIASLRRQRKSLIGERARAQSKGVQSERTSLREKIDEYQKVAQLSDALDLLQTVLSQSQKEFEHLDISMAPAQTEETVAIDQDKIDELIRERDRLIEEMNRNKEEMLRKYGKSVGAGDKITYEELIQKKELSEFGVRLARRIANKEEKITKLEEEIESLRFPLKQD